MIIPWNSSRTPNKYTPFLLCLGIFFFLERVERIYVIMKAELPQSTAFRENEASTAQPNIPAEERKIEELKVKPKISMARKLIEINWSIESPASLAS